MKNYSRIVVVLTAVMIAGLVLFAGITGSYRSSGIDTLYVNNIVQTVREKWNSPEALDSCELGTELLVFDSSDILWYSSADSELEEVECPEAALSKGYICLAVSDGTRFLGTVVMPDPDKSEYDIIRRKLLMAGGVMIAVMLLSVVLYGLYVRRTIVKPFRNMEKFAGKVAAGELDTPIIREKDNMFGAFTESFDIMREELKEARSRENALKIKEREMVASLSHDLKTPITGIKLICELLSVKVNDSYVMDKVNNIHQKAEQINILVSDLLSSALDELGEMNVECCDEVSGILHELVAEHDTRSLAREKDIPECIINADRIRLSQVIGNILSNSYKYADTPIDVDYRLSGGYLEMSLRDYGSGVPEEEISLITNKFYRGKNNSAGKDGNGLGLYISSELMARMGGELICSCRGQGLTVTLMIPLA